MKLIEREFHELKLDSKYEITLKKLKMEIGKLEAVLKEFGTYEKKFKSEYKSNIDLKHYNDLVESSRKQLAEYQKCLSLISTDREERDKATNQSEQVIDMLQSKIKKAKNNIFSNLSIRYESYDFNLDYYIYIKIT